jgi:hypothetical protein
VYKKQPKTRIDELERLMRPFEIELAVERAALEIDRLTKEKRRLNRFLKLEKKFSCEE